MVVEVTGTVAPIVGAARFVVAVLRIREGHYLIMPKVNVAVIRGPDKWLRFIHRKGRSKFATGRHLAQINIIAPVTRGNVV